MDRERDVDALETLTSTLTDSIHGYEEAAQVAKASSVAGYLKRKAEERRAVTERFRERIAALGGKAGVRGSATAAAHRQFMNLRSLFEDDAKAAVAEVERGEQYLKERFESCLNDTALSPDTRSLLSDTYERVRFDHAQWDQLKRAQQ